MLAALAKHAREAEPLLPALARAASSRYVQTAAKPSLLKEFQLYRFNPEKDEKPYYKTYRVDINKCVVSRPGTDAGPTKVLSSVSRRIHRSIALQLRPHDAGRAVQDQGGAGPILLLPTIMQVRQRAHMKAISGECRDFSLTRAVKSPQVRLGITLDGATWRKANRQLAHQAMSCCRWQCTVDGVTNLMLACREGICGSCAMNLDGKNGLACLTKTPRDGKPYKVSPLPHMFVVRDLVVDMSNFYAQYKSIKPYLQNEKVFQCAPLVANAACQSATVAQTHFVRCT